MRFLMWPADENIRSFEARFLIGRVTVLIFALSTRFSPVRYYRGGATEVTFFHRKLPRKEIDHKFLF